jgi:glycosyltransferase involved in cell wall biosynthesis
MGPIDFDLHRGFSKKKAIWPNSGSFIDFSTITQSVTAWIARKTTSFHSRTLYYFVLSLGLFANWLLISVFRFRGPGPKVAILPLGDIWSFETISADTASRYLAQLRSVPTTQISMMIYDLLPIHLPNNFLPVVVENYVSQLRLMTRCRKLLTDSNHLIPIVTAAIQMMEGASVQAIYACPPHITSNWLTSTVSKAPDEVRFLQIGALERRKNHHLTLSAFSQLLITPRTLSLVGREVKAPRLITELIHQVNETDGIVEFLYDLSDEQIIGLARSTTAMVYPSNAEGYGLPILEGLAMGLPVIASDIAPHRQFSEIGGIVYFDPTSVTSLKLAMEFVANPENNWNLRSSIRFERIPADPSSWARETRLVLEAKEPKLPCSAPSPCSD